MVMDLINHYWDVYKVKNYELLEKFPIISDLPSIKKWKEFIKTKKYVPGDLGVRIKDYSILLFIWSFLIFLIALPVQAVLAFPTLGTTIVASITSLILSIPISLFALFISSLLYFVFAKLLGGKGSFMETLDSVVLSAGSYVFVTFSLSIVLNFFSQIPLLACIFGLLQFVISLYGVYLLVHAINSAHKFNSFWKSLAVIVLPIVLMLVIMAIVILFFGTLLASMLGGAALLTTSNL